MAGRWESQRTSYLHWGRLVLVLPAYHSSLRQRSLTNQRRWRQTSLVLAGEDFRPVYTRSWPGLRGMQEPARTSFSQASACARSIGLFHSKRRGGEAHALQTAILQVTFRHDRSNGRTGNSDCVCAGGSRLGAKRSPTYGAAGGGAPGVRVPPGSSSRRITPRANAQRFSVIHSFTGHDGSDPIARPTIDRAGNLFGTTYAGGGSGEGEVFKLTRTSRGWVLTPLYSFVGGSDGMRPTTSVVFGPGGSLYGTTHGGGDTACNGGYGCGTVFKLTPPLTVCKNALLSLDRDRAVPLPRRQRRGLSFRRREIRPGRQFVRGNFVRRWVRMRWRRLRDRLQACPLGRRLDRERNLQLRGRHRWRSRHFRCDPRPDRQSVRCDPIRRILWIGGRLRS